MSKYSSNVLGCLLVVTFFTPLTLPLFTSNSLLLNTLNCLHSFRYSKSSTSEASKFLELYELWARILTDLEIVNQEDALNHTPTMSTFLNLLPS